MFIFYIYILKDFILICIVDGVTDTQPCGMKINRLIV